MDDHCEEAPGGVLECSVFGTIYVREILKYVCTRNVPAAFYPKHNVAVEYIDAVADLCWGIVSVRGMFRYVAFYRQDNVPVECSCRRTIIFLENVPCGW